MKKLSLFFAATFAVGTASAAMPVFRASCPMDLDVDADRSGAVHINGSKAVVKKFNENYYEAKGHGVTISISGEPGEAPIVSYSGRHGANGMCQVEGYAPSTPEAPAAGASSAERAGQGQFDATGNIPCAQHRGQPMGQCHFGVARDGQGSATLVVSLPDGRRRALFFEGGKAVGADLSQADGDMSFTASKEADLYKIQAGDERYEIPEAAVFGG